MKKQFVIIGIVILLVSVGPLLSGCTSNKYSYGIRFEVKNEWQADKYIEIINEDSDGASGLTQRLLSLGNDSYGFGNYTVLRKSATSTLTLTVGTYNITAPKDSEGHFIQDYAINLYESKWIILNNESLVKFIILIDETGNISVEKYSEKDRFIGMWQTASGYPSTIEFKENGELIYGAAGTWDLKDGKLVLIIPSYNFSDTYNYVFSNNDKTLALTFIENNYTQIWTKQ